MIELDGENEEKKNPNRRDSNHRNKKNKGNRTFMVIARTDREKNIDKERVSPFRGNRRSQSECAT
ncbi:hypothetical protein Bca4012_070810 [Brassica carinata]